jgi:lipopolysaccharide transport system ATP-binding protein
MTTVIKAENISKQYRLGYVGSGSIKDDVKRWWYGIRGKEDPLLNVGESNDRSRKGESDYVWALKDINFEIQQGDTVGIIGRNGAGKSTLLKLLSKVTAPTTGNIKVKGRIASLLEVGTGFHGELTGRENIYLNGAIMGMRKHEITRRLDEIVDFAGVERYLDTPVKRYSSGMYVRLGFAVAAHLDNEILIVDEVLAVGDAAFQKKCLGKMGDVAKGEGRTVLFVSHNLNAVSTLCNNSILVSNGCVINFKETSIVINKYLNSETAKMQLNEFFYLRQDKVKTNIVKTNERLEVLTEIEILTHGQYGIEIIIKDLNNNPILFFPSAFYDKSSKFILAPGIYNFETTIELPHIASGKYYMDVLLVMPSKTTVKSYENTICFEVVKTEKVWNFVQQTKQGYVSAPCSTIINKTKQ